MSKSIKQQFAEHVLISLLSPILGVYNLFKIKNEKLLIWSGTILMGIIGSIYVYVKGGDGHTHRTNVEREYLTMSLYEFIEYSIDVISLNADRGVVDIYLHTLSYISGSVFGVSELIHVFAGLVYGAVYFKGISLLMRDIKHVKLTFILLLLLIVFFFYRSITGLNAIRWWTAMWFVFTGTVGYLKTEDKKYLLIFFGSVLVHFSFFGLIIPLIFGFYFRRFKKIILLFWISSFFFAGSYELIQPYFPDIAVFKSREATLSYDPALQEIDNSFTEKRFYREYGEYIFRSFSIVLLTLVLFYFYFKKKVDSWYWILFSMGVTLYAFGNFMDFSPSVSGRSKSGSCVLILASAIQFIGNIELFDLSKKMIQLLKYTVSLFFLSSIPNILFHISYITSMLSGFVISFPVISWFLGDYDPSIRELIGYIFNI